MKNNNELNKRLLLILSPERSGSTLLSVMLGGHSKIIAPPEMHLLAYSNFESWRNEYPLAMRSLCYLLTTLGFQYDEKTIEKVFADKSPEEIYSWLIARSKKTSFVIVDKTPRYSREQTTLQMAEALKPFYIWLIRHPLGVAASQISLQLERRRSLNKRLFARVKFPAFLARSRFRRREEVLRQVAYWVDVNERIESFLKGVPKDRHNIVHYEELVHIPQAVMDKVCEALGLEFETDMINPCGNLPGPLQRGLGDEKILTHKTIDASVADRWKQHYDEGFLNGRTREVMKRLCVL